MSTYQRLLDFVKNPKDVQPQKNKTKKPKVATPEEPDEQLDDSQEVRSLMEVRPDLDVESARAMVKAGE